MIVNNLGAGEAKYEVTGPDSLYMEGLLDAGVARIVVPPTPPPYQVVFRSSDGNNTLTSTLTLETSDVLVTRYETEVTAASLVATK